MKKYLFTFISIIIVLIVIGKSRNVKELKIKEKVQIKESYKDLKKKGKLKKNTEHLDTLRKVYSNYFYNIGFDAPDSWTIDKGMNKNTIFRTYQKDSAITFIIIVAEPKYTEKKEPNAWEVREGLGGKEYDKLFIENLEKQSRNKISNFKVKKSYLKNNVCVKMTFETLIKELDFEYKNVDILYQTIVENKSFSFGLSVPKMYYELNESYYENLFRNIYFLNNGSL
ncbi:hypothetical protein F7647_10750 [Tenacibaculum piscium]|uniref:hypothetical protein n=1 Tax=Tenacibaculum piscium TaxID=1458515 RepID=UPI00187BC1B0|nr:hypothetical protein [Tenacibaculum piscium]MBE7686528.1 hypothetical protein [Tenacibaculum piscium]MBE7691259.1 hypothetical protein [Tenacibaculum piscium]